MKNYRGYPRDSVYKDGLIPHVTQPYDYFQNQATIDYNSNEGVAILDNWYKKTIEDIQSLASKHKTILCDLSGGMDTRALLAMIFNSGCKDHFSFYIHTPDADAHPKYVEDYEIANEIVNKYQLRTIEKKYLNIPYPRISGICSNFKTRPELTDDRIANPDAYGDGFSNIIDMWKKDHPDYDEMDLRQISWEVTFVHWHDIYKVERERKARVILAPYNDLELKKLKNKRYGLWLYFMNKFCPELLEFKVQGRGIFNGK